MTASERRLVRAICLMRLIEGSHRSWPALVLADRLAVSRRTVYRDLALLEAAGVALYTDAYGWRVVVPSASAGRSALPTAPAGPANLRPASRVA